MEITGASAPVAALATIAAPASVPPVQAAANRDLIQAVKAVNEAETFGANNELSFQIDRNSHLPVVQIIDRTSKKVVEQIPAEYILELAQTLGEKSDSTSFSALA